MNNKKKWTLKVLILIFTCAAMFINSFYVKAVPKSKLLTVKQAAQILKKSDPTSRYILMDYKESYVGASKYAKQINKRFYIFTLVDSQGDAADSNLLVNKTNGKWYKFAPVTPGVDDTIFDAKGRQIQEKILLK